MASFFFLNFFLVCCSRGIAVSIFCFFLAVLAAHQPSPSRHLRCVTFGVALGRKRLRRRQRVLFLIISSSVSFFCPEIIHCCVGGQDVASGAVTHPPWRSMQIVKAPRALGICAVRIIRGLVGVVFVVPALFLVGGCGRSRPWGFRGCHRGGVGQAGFPSSVRDVRPHGWKGWKGHMWGYICPRPRLNVGRKWTATWRQWTSSPWLTPFPSWTRRWARASPHTCLLRPFYQVKNPPRRCRHPFLESGHAIRYVGRSIFSTIEADFRAMSGRTPNSSECRAFSSGRR
ncbi:unnamed protein product [Ectocarpus sp. 13 AM-2016]